MSRQSCSVPVFFGLAIVFSMAGITSVYAQCVGHEVVGVHPHDLVCHFENEYCGTSTGSVSLGPSAWQTGLLCNGGYVTVGDEDKYSAWRVEIECQVMFTQLPGQGSYDAGLVTKYRNGSPASSEWGLYVRGNEVSSPSWMLTGNGVDRILSDGGVALNTLYCVKAVFYRDGNSAIFVDGALVAHGVLTSNAGNTTTPVVIGNAASGENSFYGMIDEVRVGRLEVPIGTEKSTWGSIKNLYR